MELSIVATLFHSARYLEEFYRRMSAVASELTPDYEVIFVNDGSPDESLDIAVSLCGRDRRVRVIDLSRNFGHHKAMLTGLAHADGEWVFLIDCDLEIQPEVLREFYSALQGSDADVIYGVQEKRQDSWMDRVLAGAFYTLFNWLSVESLPVNLTTVRLMSRRYVSALVAHRERESVIGGLWVITGFKQIPRSVAKLNKRKSSYNVARKLSVLVNAITSFSNRPLIFIFYLGLGISIFSGLAVSYLVIRSIITGFLPGWPSLIASVWLLGGLSIFCVGIVGVYVARIFMETKQRPYTIVRERYGYPLGKQEQIQSGANAHRERGSVRD